jgi:hypothetical protein
VSRFAPRALPASDKLIGHEHGLRIVRDHELLCGCASGRAQRVIANLFPQARIEA